MNPQEILQAVTTNKMTVKQAFVLINDMLKNSSPEESITLYELSNSLINHDLPLLAPDEESEIAWHKEMYGEEDEIR